MTRSRSEFPAGTILYEAATSDLWSRHLGAAGFEMLPVELPRNGSERFNIPRVAERIEGAISELGQDARPVGLLFDGVAGAAALWVSGRAAAKKIAGVAVTQGRPELAGPVLPDISCPVLLIFGEHNPLERQAGAVAGEVVPRAEAICVKGVSRLDQTARSYAETTAWIQGFFDQCLLGRNTSRFDRFRAA